MMVAAATDLIKEALEVAQTSGAKVAVAESDWNLAQIAIHRWEPDAVASHAEKALGLASELDLEELVACGPDIHGISTTSLTAGRSV